MKKYLCGLFRHEPVTVKNKDEAREAFHCADCSDFPSCYGGPRRTALPHEYRAPVKQTQTIGDVVNLPKPKQKNDEEVLREHFEEIKEMRSSVLPIPWDEIKNKYGFKNDFDIQRVFAKRRLENAGIVKDKGVLKRLILENLDDIREMRSKSVSWQEVQEAINILEAFSTIAVKVTYHRINKEARQHEQARND